MSSLIAMVGGNQVFCALFGLCFQKKPTFTETDLEERACDGLLAVGSVIVPFYSLCQVYKDGKYTPGYSLWAVMKVNRLLGLKYVRGSFTSDSWTTNPEFVRKKYVALVRVGPVCLWDRVTAAKLSNTPFFLSVCFPFVVCIGWAVLYS